ncbi:MAG TPA: TetR/AcrR family transcriptional regulator [Gemmatimonadaceae bacterium]|nr:TetR/AcrR family transcriptional regulator [Gemmatimonadaceae bacterium]
MTSPRFRPPQQHRSQETLDRILDAAERVLDAKSFSEATLVEIMERAGMTLGAFYRRFPDKDALLHLMDERFFAELYVRGDAVLEPTRWVGLPISEIVREFTREAVLVYRERRGLLRSLFLRARIDPVIQESARLINAHLIDRLLLLLLPRVAEIKHPDPRRAIELGYVVLVGAIRETTLFGEVWPSPNGVDGIDLTEELARLYLGYLGVV